MNLTVDGRGTMKVPKERNLTASGEWLSCTYRPIITPNREGQRIRWCRQFSLTAKTTEKAIDCRKLCYFAWGVNQVCVHKLQEPVQIHGPNVLNNPLDL